MKNAFILSPTGNRMVHLQNRFEPYLPSLCGDITEDFISPDGSVNKPPQPGIPVIKLIRQLKFTTNKVMQ